MTGPGSPDLELTIGGQLLRFPAIWLRDNCSCPACVAPGTSQKLNDITDMPNGVAITRTDHAAGSVTVTFAPDRHRSEFSRSWLAAHAPGRASGDDSDGYERAEAVFPAGVVPADKYWPPVRRIDGAYGDRNLVCSCPSPEAFED